MEFIFRCFSFELVKIIRAHNIEKIEEIRIRAGKNVILKLGQIEAILKYIVTESEIVGILQNICSNSLYAYQNQICNGFITLPGGHRVGITGNVVVKDGQVINISHIYSLNFRISHQIIGSSNEVLKFVLDPANNSVFNTLIVSPPGAGKTTIIRDIAKKISDGINEINFKGIDISIIDERGEIAALNKGITYNDVGLRSDVLDNVPKILGIRMAIRSMSPKVIIVDEIGNKDDAQIINYAICSGVKCICTAHGSEMEDLLRNSELQQIMKLQLFDKVIFLDEKRKGYIKNIVTI